MLEQLQNFCCGTISGWVQVIVMQPFEIIKVRLQTQSCFEPQYNGIYDCLKKIFKEEGPLAFYKGTLVPLLGVGAQVSLQFGSNELTKKTMEQFHDNDEDILPMSLIMISGMLAGIPSSIAVTPIDHLRILLQVQHGKNQKYHGSIQAGVRIFKKHGIKGLYLGFPITLYRQILAMGVYFGSYEGGMRLLAPEGQSSAKAPLQAAFFIGGLSGMLSWLFTYPLDYTKTIIQSDDLDNRRYKTTMQCFRQRLSKDGSRSFYRGLGITMIRSFPVNASGFLSFETAMRFMGNKQ